jgi:F-type H+-transporting ATPase subunit epsilon
MARTKFRVEVLTPEGEVFNDEVEMVSTRTEVGSIGVLANHQPLLGMLAPTELRLYRSESDVERFAQGEGYIQVSGEQVLVLVEEAIHPNKLNAGDLRERARRAEQRARAAEDGSEEQQREENEES